MSGTQDEHWEQKRRYARLHSILSNRYKIKKCTDGEVVTVDSRREGPERKQKGELARKGDGCKEA